MGSPIKEKGTAGHKGTSLNTIKLFCSKREQEPTAEYNFSYFALLC
jgi:hypothetical protein